MTIEDLLTKLNDQGMFFATSFDRKFVRSLSYRISEGTALTTRQGYALVAMLKKSETIHDCLNLKPEVVREILDNPKWRLPLTPSVELKPQVRHLGDNVLAFRSSLGGKKFADAMTDLKHTYHNGVTLVVMNNTKNLNRAIEIIGQYGFEMDEDTEKYLAVAMDLEAEEPRVIAMGDQMLFDVPNLDPVAHFFHHVLGGDYL